MKIPTISGIIDRRILINYRVNVDILSRYLPASFRPKLVNGYGIAGICLIRLKNIRPKGLPSRIGVSSENGAHRIAVEWFENGVLKEGVYIPRRDTSSTLNAWAGGRIFPGTHHLAKFRVNESRSQYEVGFESEDGTSLYITAKPTERLNKGSLFPDLSSVSEFFRKGSVGYSPNSSNKTFDGLKLTTQQWSVSPLEVSEVSSAFFENKEVFPTGSVEFDNALLMQHIDHEWHSLPEIK